MAGLLSVGLAAGALTGVALVAAPAQPATAAPGSPGVPQPTTVVFAEDFENVTGTAPVGLTDYTGAGGQRYTADPAWLTACNGQIRSFNTPYTTLGNCASTAYTSNLGQLAYALGAHAGAGDPAANEAVTAYTENNPGTNAVQFRTVQNIPLASASGRFLTFSVDTAAVNCGVSAPRYQFAFVDGSGAATSVGGVLNACSSGETVPVPAHGTLGARTVNVGTYTSDGSVLFDGSELGIRMTNANGSGIGNDAAFDNIRILDVTPQLDKEFSPSVVTPGQPSTLTFTVTNTAELAAKDGWSFTDELPAGLQVADPSAAATDCPAGTVTAAAGSTTITAGGNLSAGMESCTVTVAVTGLTAGTYVNGPDNVTSTGLNEPGETTLDITPSTVQCSTDANVFNTGYDAATGGILPNGATDPSWQVAGPFPASATVAVPPADADWAAANVGNLAPGAWTASPYGNAQWISQQTMQSPGQGGVSGDWYYRYQFMLAEEVDAARFALAMNFLADNAVAEVFVNGEPQSDNTTGLPQFPLGPDNGPGSAPYYSPGFTADNAAQTTLDADWRTGLNTIVVQIKSGPNAEGFNAQIRPSVLCPQPALSITKTSDATAETRAGDTVTYTVTAENTGTGDYTAEEPATVTDDLSAVLDDATWDDRAEASAPGELAFAGPRLSWTGALPAGDVVTLTYTVTLTGAGDGVVRNVAFAGDGETPACDPPTEEGTDPATGVPCSASELELPRLSITKTADQVDLPAIGADVTYTLTVTNQGPGDYTAEAPATATDELGDVLDDGTLDEASITADVGTASLEGDRLTWSGPLGADESATISYTVTYTGGGDSLLVNRVCVPTDQTAPGALPCDSVRVPASNLEYWKTVDPASGAAVRPGEDVTYTLSFRNDGQADGQVDSTDDLSGVLDDADLVDGPTASDAALTVSDVVDGRISVTGTLVPGQTVTVTYTVRVHAWPDDASGEDVGDDVLGNVLADPNGVCLLGDCSTENPVAHLTVEKTSTAPADVNTGDTVTYTVTVTNDGQVPHTADAPASVTDDLSAVLDDAAFNDDAEATVGEVSYAAPSLTWTGALGVGEQVRITYSVTVTNAGDHVLENTATLPPELCLQDCGSTVVTDLPYVVPDKASDPLPGEPVQAGQVITYTLTFTNGGSAAGPVDSTDDLSGVLDDADVTGVPVSDTEGVTAVRTGTDLRVVGTLAAGQTATVTYQVTVKPDGQRGDNVAGNVLTPDVPVLECADGTCQELPPPATEHPIGELDDWKTVQPASGTTVQPGAEMTYTLHFANTGQADVPVDRQDVLTGVLDDADLTTGPTASDAGLTVSDVADGRFTVTGTLAPEQEVTVTYTVTVREDGERGDDVLGNFLVATGEQPPAECAPTDAERPDCTVNWASHLTAAKSSDPASGTAVEAGQEVTYTLTFTNTSSTPDAASEPVAYTDHMANVLDDATLTSDPVADEPLTAVVDGDIIVVAGDLPAGTTATVTYTVTVDPPGEGDRALGNVVAVTGTEPVCAEDSPLCTWHDVDDPAAPSTPDEPEQPSAGGPLPQTGATVGGVAAAAVLLLLLGLAAVHLARRRTDG